MSEFAASSYQLETAPPGVVRGGLPSGAILSVSIVSKAYETSENGASINLKSPGLFFVVVPSGEFIGIGATLFVKFQESADQSSWTDISGTSIEITQNNILTANYRNSQQYVRAVIEVSGTISANCCALIGKL